MKHLRFALIVLLLTGCSKEAGNNARPETDITLVRDITDEFILQPISDPILALFDFPHNRDQAAIFRLILLGDKQSNPVEEFRIADGKTTERDNEDEDVDDRDNRVHAFFDSTSHAISDFPMQYVPADGSLQHSECFAVVASELERLASRTASRKILIVFSDLMENAEFSCYTPEGQRLLESNPDKVVQILLRLHPLPQSLAGITAYFVYLPRTREEDARYGKMEAIYAKLLRTRGARVVVQVTNKTYEP